MHAFCEQLLDGLGRCGVEKRLLVATSGGADSVALLRGLAEIGPSLSLELGVAHLNHRLRGDESDADAAWVADLAATLNLPCEIGVLAPGDLNRHDIIREGEAPAEPLSRCVRLRGGSGGASPSQPKAPSPSLEEKARVARYQFLDEAAAKFECSTIVLAHSADDLTETVLHHLLRGTGIAGLCGIPPVRQLNSGRRLVRPMLNIPRSLIEDYLQELGQSFRVDSTNADTRLTRNRLRHVVLPMLRDQINPQVDVAIKRLAEQAVEIDQFLKESARQLLNESLKNAESDLCHLDIECLANRSRHLVREMFCVLWQRLGWPRQSMGFEQWNRLIEILHSRETITLPGCIEARFLAGNLLVLRRL